MANFWEIGEIDNSPIGQNTPAAGAFTVLKASTDPADAHGVGDKGYNDTQYTQKSTFDANTILKADSDNTPVALTIPEQTIVGRITAGVIAALTATQIRTLLNVEESADVTDNANVITAGALTKVSTTTIAFNAVAATTLYTVPAGKTFIPVFVIVRAGADAALTDITFGRVGALTDFLGTMQLDNLDAAGDQVLLQPAPQDPALKLKTYAAGVVFQVDVIVAQGGVTNYIDLFGYLV